VTTDSVLGGRYDLGMSVSIRAGADVTARLAELAAGRPIVIDHFASRRCGTTIGDLRVRFGADLAETRVVEAPRIEGVPVFVEADLVELFDGGASLRVVGPSFAPHLAVRLDRPEAWLDFLHSHPHSRR